ncbi:MAG TPA: response regulator [Pseudonocardiaceae bacterium]|nr:response regulator [Pseudonocardiaceae bacterium]
MSQTISAIASLLWPLIVLAVLVLFRGPLTRVIRSTEKRDFTIQVAGQSVSVGELHRQQMDMMADLHDQVTALRKDVDALRVAGPGRISGASRVAADIPVAVAASSYGANVASNGPANDTELTDVDVPSPARPLLPADMAKAPWERLELPAQDQDPVDEPAAPQAGLSVVPGPDDLPAWTAARPDTRPKPAGVLWVDDEPAHNALQLDQLERRGIVVDTARSTREAVQKLTGQRYQIIVSDMERVEGGKPVPNAGLELIRTVRTFDRETPVVIYSSGPAGKILGDTAAQIGADLVTSSWYQLSQELRRVGVL